MGAVSSSVPGHTVTDPCQVTTHAHVPGLEGGLLQLTSPSTSPRRTPQPADCHSGAPLSREEPCLLKRLRNLATW